MNHFKIIAFTHKTVAVEEVGKFYIGEAELEARLKALKAASKIEELMYLATCNRVEFLLSTPESLTPDFLRGFFKAFNAAFTIEEIEWAASSAMVFEGEEAIRHLFNVASSVDSLVVGEREIITQVRNAYEKCNTLQLTGDLIRLIIKSTIETAKKVYTHTLIAKKPVSVVSLAYRKLKELHVKLDAKFLIIGAGVTNSNMAKYLKKHGFKYFTVFNRSLDNAKRLATALNGQAFSLSELKNYEGGFDVILTCTGASEYVITNEIYHRLVGNDRSKKIIIDLAVPNDLDPAVLTSYDIKLIAVNNLQSIARENLQERQKELDACKRIIEESLAEFRQALKARKVELAMSEVPKKVKEIKEAALNSVFAKDLAQLDDQSKAVLDKILAYVEKKYISVPMRMAKDILIND